MDIRVIDHIGLNVRSLDVSAEWYARVFGMTIVHKFTSTWMIGTGAVRLGLFHRPEATPVEDLDNRVAITHIAFLLDPLGFAAAQEQLRQLGVAFEPPDDIGVAHSLFIVDPDGHQLELIAYHA